MELPSHWNVISDVEYPNDSLHGFLNGRTYFRDFWKMVILNEIKPSLNVSDKVDNQMEKVENSYHTPSQS